ncbi:uncharacterized protein [Vulpes vulpes]|uniref:Basic proline-rich protein-like n=1 Tax=Vulpes vulpes TaxID=9627 RepID=A0ABM4XJN7_VULVU
MCCSWCVGRCSPRLLSESACAQAPRTQDLAQAPRIPEPAGDVANPAPSRWRLAEPFLREGAVKAGDGLPCEVGARRVQGGETVGGVWAGVGSSLPQGSSRSLLVSPGACLLPPPPLIGQAREAGALPLAGGAVCPCQGGGGASAALSLPLGLALGRAAAAAAAGAPAAAAARASGSRRRRRRRRRCLCCCCSSSIREPPSPPPALRPPPPPPLPEPRDTPSASSGCCLPASPLPPFPSVTCPPLQPSPAPSPTPRVPAPPARAAPEGSGTCGASRGEGELRPGACLTGCRGCTSSSSSSRRHSFAHRNPILRVHRSCRFCCLQSGSEGSSTAAGTEGPAGARRTPAAPALWGPRHQHLLAPLVPSQPLREGTVMWRRSAVLRFYSSAGSSTRK